MTIGMDGREQDTPQDVVQESLAETFPASDAPAWTSGTAVGSPATDADVVPKAVVQRFFRFAIDQKDPGALDLLVAEDVRFHSSDEVLEGREAFRAWIAELTAALPDCRVTVHSLLAEGADVASRLTVEGSHDGPLLGMHSTGQQVSFTAQAMFHIEGGRIAEAWFERDGLALAQRLGRTV